MEPPRAEARGSLFLRPFGAKIPTDFIRGLQAAVLERRDKLKDKGWEN
jgi:hypothetical protein